jgi:hypothetical protein
VSLLESPGPPACVVQELAISQNLRLYSISLELISLQILTDCPSAKRRMEDGALGSNS